MIKISIIVPIYNSESYLHRCLDSIINQTFEDIEVLLIDDGSTDSSGLICKECEKKDSRFHYIYKENGGVSTARNIGLKEATGDWIMFVDSDDWISNNYCELMLKIAYDNSLDIIQCRRVDEKDAGEYKQSVTQKEYLKIYAFDNFNPSEEDFYGTCWGFLFKSSIIKNLCFDESLHFTEDALFSVEAMSSAKKIGILNEFLYHYNLTEHDSLSALIYNEKKMGIIDSRTKQLSFFKGKLGEHTMQGRLADGCYYLYDIGKNNNEFMKNHYNEISKIFRKYFVQWNHYRGGSSKRKLFRYIYIISLRIGYFLESKI